jgi:hypothetical protein
MTSVSGTSATTAPTSSRRLAHPITCRPPSRRVPSEPTEPPTRAARSRRGNRTTRRARRIAPPSRRTRRESAARRTSAPRPTCAQTRRAVHPAAARAAVRHGPRGEGIISHRWLIGCRAARPDTSVDGVGRSSSIGPGRACCSQPASIARRAGCSQSQHKRLTGGYARLA